MRTKSNEKENRILNAALTLFVEKGIEQTSTAQIAKEAGIATGTLFTYFKTKEDLIDAVYSRSMSNVVETALLGLKEDLSPFDFIKELSKSYITWVQENKEEFYYIDLYNSSVYKKYYNINSFFESSHFNEMLRRGKEEGIFKDLPLDFIVQYWTKGINGVAAYAVSKNFDVDDPIIDEMVSVLIDGIIRK